MQASDATDKCVVLFLNFLVFSLNSSLRSTLFRVAKANELKVEGNAFFKEGEWKKALRSYHFAWLNVKGLGESAMSLAGPGGGSTLPAEQQEVIKALTESLHLNLAACYLRTEQFEKCIKACSTAISVNENSTKGTIYLYLSCD